MKKAVVTGATSGIGIALVGELLKSEREIYAVIRPTSQRLSFFKSMFPNVSIIEVDMSQIGSLSSSLKQGFSVCDFDEFYNIAWSKDFENPRYNAEGQKRNVKFAEEAIKAAVEIGCDSFLCIGSQAECGRINEPINSGTPDNPLNAYSTAKCRAYEKCCEIGDEFGIKLFWPRLLSAYGPYGVKDSLIMKCIVACIERKEIELTKGEQIWDFVYLTDVARALRLIVEKGKPRKKYSIASGIGRPLVEYIGEISEVFEYPELMKGVGKREYSENEVMYLVGDISELNHDTGMIIENDFKSNILSMKHILNIS